MIKELWNGIKALYEKEFKFTEDTYMSYKDLHTNLGKQFKDCHIEVSDNRMYFVEHDEMNRFLNLNIFRYLKFIAERRDCDNYSAVLNGLFKAINGQHACGMVSVVSPTMGKHALNCFIDIFGKFNYIEPQTNMIMNPKETDYTPYMILI